MNVQYVQADKLLTLNEDLGKKLAEAERLAEEDEKEASEELMKEVAELNAQKHELEVCLTFTAKEKPHVSAADLSLESAWRVGRSN